MKYNVFQNVLFLLKDIKKEYPFLLLLIFLQMILSVVFPVFGIYLPKLALELVLEGADSGRIGLLLGAFGLVMALSMALSGMAGEGKYMMYNDMRRYYQTELVFQSLSCDYKNVESKEGQAKYQKAMSTLQAGDCESMPEDFVTAGSSWPARSVMDTLSKIRLQSSVNTMVFFNSAAFS